jgi:hypothetical protein
MSYDWGPHYIVPATIFKSYSGVVVLREELDEYLLRKELEELHLPEAVEGITNPWYFRKKGVDTWLKIGESDDRDEYFPVEWDTTALENGQYEIQGLMHVSVRSGVEERVIARQNVVEVTVKN